MTTATTPTWGPAFEAAGWSLKHADEAGGATWVKAFDGENYEMDFEADELPIAAEILAGRPTIGADALASAVEQRRRYAPLAPVETPAVDAPPVEALQAPLSGDEQQDLRELEQVIERGQKTFVEVGKALIAIRDERLYRATHTSFEAYLGERWPEIGKRRAYQLIDAVEIAQNVNHGDPNVPPVENERQVRPLAGLKPEEQKQAWREAAARAGGTAPTGKQVEQAAAKYKTPAPTPTPAAPAPAPLPQPLPMLTPLQNPMLLASVPDQQALVAAALTVAYCEEQALEARRRLVALREAAASAGVPMPSMEVPGDAVATAARLALDAPAMKAQVAMLAFSVRVEAA